MGKILLNAPTSLMYAIVFACCLVGCASHPIDSFDIPLEPADEMISTRSAEPILPSQTNAGGNNAAESVEINIGKVNLDRCIHGQFASTGIH